MLVLVLRYVKKYIFTYGVVGTYKPTNVKIDRILYCLYQKLQASFNHVT